MTTPQPLQQVIDEKEDEINVMRIVVAVLAVIVLFLLIILAYCTCTKRLVNVDFLRMITVFEEQFYFEE